MSLELNTYAALYIIAVVILTPLTWIIYRARPEARENRRLAFFVLVQALFSLGVLSSYVQTTPAGAYAGILIVWPLVVVQIPAYLWFVATFECPLARPLQHPVGDRVLLGLIVGALLAGPFWAPRIVHGIVPFEPYVPYRAVWGATFDWVLRVLAVVSIFATVVVVWAWRRTRPGSARRRQLAWYAAAAITYDVLTIGRTAVLWPILASAVRAGEVPPAWVIQTTLAANGLVFAIFGAMLGYAILHAQVFDIDLRIKRGLSRSTVAAIFVAMFFLVSEGAAAFFADRTGSTLVGLLGAAILIVFIAPLQRLADRVSDAAMPSVRDTPEYRAERAREIYAAAVESALEDGTITERERDVLATLAEKFELKHTEARQIERDIVAAAGGELS